ncbi:aminotransferase class III-fold pyridoxal phosphate-dependent enzyme [Curvibacter sp. APW13]|uniref:aminotransferase class III-fold pyridoxal phosphate-dependent enzyme n=1 Tax=Curvibacter sp. APW13 TaxID=3077236 RepID=UPI0028DE24D2|nr:aminotransferase class III-fold pyridoxal phosphate-dependent enzyme [Curvibacter sp. APW13]MDT8991385.1 aminotransferase class III-fold pyridoxal phosphate-dependent enzyme [Curvibacter sp. APW13]
MLTKNPFYELPQVHTALPGPASSALFARHDAQLTGANADHEIYPLLEVGKRGYLIEDADGNTFADHMSAWGASPFGPTPPTVKAAMDAAWARHGMQISGWLPNQAAFSLVDKLTRIAPGRLSRVEYSVSGTLAVEAAVKFMREATKRPLIITFGGQYHGESTYMTAGASSDLSNVSSGRTQYVSGVVMVPYPNRFRSPFRRGPGPVDECEVLDYLDYLLIQQVHPCQVAGVMIEPVLGEGGIHAPSQRFWDRLGALCKRWGWLLCLDEVQTCMGRTGTMFAMQRWEGIDPDLLLLGKAFAAGGQPIAAVLGTDAVMAHTELHLGSTYGFAPAACAGALAGIELIEAGGVLENALALERIFKEVLEPLKAEVEQLGDVRAVGAMAALEFVVDKASNRPAPAFQYAVHHAVLRRGVVGISQRGKWHYRLQPALTMTPEVFRHSCEQIALAVREVAANPPKERIDVQDAVATAQR